MRQEMEVAIRRRELLSKPDYDTQVWDFLVIWFTLLQNLMLPNNPKNYLIALKWIDFDFILL